MGSSKLPSLDPFLDICSDTDFVVNENPSKVEFTCPKLVNPSESLPEDADSESDSDWEEEDTTTMEMHLTFLKIKTHPHHLLVLLIFDICFICFLCFLKSMLKLQFQAFCFTPPFLSPNWF